MEPHLRALYFEIYFLLAQKFYNASLVLMGILLESMIKEKLHLEKILDDELEEMNFGQAIKKCRNDNILTKLELDFLEDRNKKLRKPYAHYNKMKLSQGIYFQTHKISNPVKKIIELHEKVLRGELTEKQSQEELMKDTKPEFMSSKEFRPLAQIAKNEREKREAINVFLEIDKFVREFSEKYFKPK